MLIVLGLATNWLLVVKLLSQKSDLNFRRCEKELSQFWIFSLYNSHLTNMINSNAFLFLQILNQKFILSFNLVWWWMDAVDNLFISETLKFVLCWNSLIKLVENVFETFFNVVDHLISFFDWLLSTFRSLFVEIFILYNFLEKSFVRFELIIRLGFIFTFESGSELIKLVLIFLQFSFGSENFQSGLIFNLLLINGQKGFRSVSNSKTSWK